MGQAVSRVMRDHKMTVTNEKPLDGGNTLVSTQGAGSTNGSDVQEHGLAQICDLWSGIEVPVHSSSRYTLPGIVANFSTEAVDTKAAREPVKSGIHLSKTVNDSAVTEVDEKALKPTESRGGKTEVLSPIEKIELALQNYYLPSNANEERQQVIKSVFGLMREYKSKFVELAVETVPKKTYRKIPRKTYIEDVWHMSGLGGDFDFSKVRHDEWKSYLGIKNLDMFYGKAEFWGVVRTEFVLERAQEPDDSRVETLQRSSSLKRMELSESSPKRPEKKDPFGLFGKLFQFLSTDSQRNSVPKTSSKKSLPSKDEKAAPSTSEIRSVAPEPTERIIRETPGGIGVMTYSLSCSGNGVQGNITHIGNFDKEGRLQGQGVARVPGLGVFQGNFRDGYPHGQGCLYHENGDRYEGRYDHGVGRGSAVFTTNGGRRSTSDNTILGNFRETVTVELDPHPLNSSGHSEDEAPKKSTGGRLDGSMSVKKVEYVPGYFSAADKYRHYRRVDGGYLTFKEKKSDKGVFGVYRLTSAAGRTECQYDSPPDGLDIHFGGESADKIGRGGNLSGKKKK